MKHVFSGNGQLEFDRAASLASHSLQCAYCGNTVAPNTGYTAHCHQERIYIYKCPLCSNPIIYNEHTGDVFPEPKFGRDIKGLPDDIQALYNECRVCYSNQCYIAAQMAARALLRHVAVEEGAEEGMRFAEYITFLDTNGFIPPSGKKWVNYIRHSGDFPDHQIVTKDKKETERVILFLSALLLFIYEMPMEMGDSDMA